MKKEDLEIFLNKDNELGFKNAALAPDSLGWILLRKERVDYRYLSLLEDEEEPEFVNKQKEIEEKPYIVRVIELKKSKHEDKFYQEEIDVNDIHRFANLDEVQYFLDRYKKSLEDIKWRIEIDAP